MNLQFDMNMICGRCENRSKNHFEFNYLDDNNFEIKMDDKIIFKKGV